MNGPSLRPRPNASALARRALGTLLASWLCWSATLHNAAAQSPEDACDLAAAHPADKTRAGEGVPDDSLIPGLALAACEAAAKTSRDPRVTFQLGRAYRATDRQQDAFNAFRKAADAGHVVAMGYLGDAYLFGRGTAKNLDLARKFYKKAEDGGYAAAKVMLEAITFDPQLYLVPMIAGLYQGIGQLTESLDLRRQPVVLGYVFSLATGVNGDCRGALKPAALMTLLKLRYKGAVTHDVASSGDFQVLSSAGDYDADTFVQRHGCDGPVSEQLVANLNKYLALHGN